MKPVLHVGIDIGSTTVKVAALSPYLKLVFGRYARHMSDIRHATEACFPNFSRHSPDTVSQPLSPEAAAWGCPN